MNEMTINFNTKINDKIVIKDDSDDSFLSGSSDDSIKSNNLFNKLKNNKNNKLKNNKNNYKNNNKKTITNKFENKTIVNESKNILENSYILFQKSLENYYNEVLECLNMLYNNESKSILKIQIKKISLDKIIFEKYNEIVKKHKLKKKLFDIDNFDVDDEHDYDTIIDIAKIITQNLIEKLNYKLCVIKSGDKKIFQIKNLSKEI